MINIVNVILFIVIIVLLGLLFIVRLFFKVFWDYVGDIIKENYDYYFRRTLEKAGIVPPKKEDLSPQIKIVVVNVEKYVEKEFNIEVKANIEQDFIELKDDKLTTKNQKIKLNMLYGGFKDTYSITAVNYVHPSVYNLLENEKVKTGFQLYFAYKSSIVNKNEETTEFIENGLSNLSEDNKTIKEWFDIFKKLDIEGDFLSIVLPISKEIKILDDNINKEFTKFVRDISIENKFVQPFKIGTIKVGIIKVGTRGKHPIVYYNYLANLKKEGKVDIIIICARGGWINLCRDLGDWAKALFNMEDNHIKIKYYSNMKDFISDKEGIEALRIYLKSKS